MDFFTVPTVTFRILTVWFMIHHGRRKIVHFDITEHPTVSGGASQRGAPGRTASQSAGLGTAGVSFWIAW